MQACKTVRRNDNFTFMYMQTIEFTKDGIDR